jgi:AraC-like DNA-binding protein
MPRVERDLFRRLCLARDLLREASAEPLSVAQVADEVTISRFHFIRRFEGLFGATPHEYRVRVRIERAKELLARGEHSVTDTCLEVGFTSLGSFSTLFRRHVGASPSDYRRAARALIVVPGEIPRVLVPGCLTLMGALAPDVFRNSREARHGDARQTAPVR